MHDPVVGIVVGESGLPAPAAAAAARARGDLLVVEVVGELGVDGIVVGWGQRAAQQKIADVGEPLRDLVDRGGRDHEQAEGQQQDQQWHRHPRRDQALQGPAHALADQAAGELQLPHADRILSEVQQAGGGHEQGGPADQPPATVGRVARLAHQPDRAHQHQQRQRGGDRADEQPGRAGQPLPHRTRRREPDGDTEQDGQTQQEQAGAVTAMLRIQVPGGSGLPAHRAGHPADAVGHAHPQGPHRTAGG